jgi:hypothetical protein
MEPETEQGATGFSLQEYLAILRRRRAVIIQAFILIGVIGVAQALMAKNVYEASFTAPGTPKGWSKTAKPWKTCGGKALACPAQPAPLPPSPRCTSAMPCVP